MFTIHEGIIQSDNFTKDVHIIHGFTTRLLGDMCDPSKRIGVVKTIGFDPSLTCWQHQTHSTVVSILNSHPFGGIYESDGIILPNIESLLAQGVLLTVHVADCIPVLFFDPKRKSIAVAHSGWKGTLGGICSEIIHGMINTGSTVDSIKIALGPHIRPCCYNSDSLRLEKFKERFGNAALGKTASGVDSIDLMNALVFDALAQGIKPGNIDVSAVSCTSCHPKEYFSYRSDKGNLSGEIMGFIGYNRLS